MVGLDARKAICDASVRASNSSLACHARVQVQQPRIDGWLSISRSRRDESPHPFWGRRLPAKALMLGAVAQMKGK